MIQRHFAVASKAQLKRTAPLAMLVLTVLVGGTYFIAALSRLILPDVTNPDAVMPQLVQMLLPTAGMHVFVLAIVSASLSTATALFHIAATAIAEDIPARKSTRLTWTLAAALCVLVSGVCAQAEGRLIALLCATSWSMIGSMALVPYLALVLFGQRNAVAAWCSAAGGFSACLFWYLFVSMSTAVTASLLPQFAQIPPFFIGAGVSIAGWFAGMAFAAAVTKQKRTSCV